MSYQEYFGETHNILRQSIRTFMEREVHPYIDEWAEEDDWAKEGPCAGLGMEETAQEPRLDYLVATQR